MYKEIKVDCLLYSLRKLFAQIFGRTLLLEGGQTLDTVPRRDHIRVAELLDLERRVDVDLDARVDGRLGHAHRYRSVVGDLASQLEGSLVRPGAPLVLLHAVAHQPDVLGLLAFQHPSRVDELLGLGHADQSGESLGSARARNNRQLGLDKAQLGIRGFRKQDSLIQNAICIIPVSNYVKITGNSKITG